MSEPVPRKDADNLRQTFGTLEFTIQIQKAHEISALFQVDTSTLNSNFTRNLMSSQGKSHASKDRPSDLMN